MISAVCKDGIHTWCRGHFKELLKSGMTGTQGQDLVSFGAKVKCECPCHIKDRYER